MPTYVTIPVVTTTSSLEPSMVGYVAGFNQASMQAITQYGLPPTASVTQPTHAVWYKVQTGDGHYQWQCDPAYPIGTNQPMFTPLVGTLYYHTIPSTTVITSPYLLTQRATGDVQSWWAMPDTPTQPRRVRTRPDGRRILRRSIDLFRRLRPESEIKTFLSGEPLTIHGHRFDYRVKNRDNLLSHSMNPHSAHIPYDLHLVHKRTGRTLAKGCVIVPGTPVIDQLLALILHVEDVNEEPVVIHTTNWTPQLPRDAVEAAEADYMQRLAA